MPDTEAKGNQTESPAHKRLWPTFPLWHTIIAMATQVTLCGLAWVFVGLLFQKKILPLHDTLVNSIYNNPLDTNLLITVISTLLAFAVSSLACFTIKRALLFRLPHGLRFPSLDPWIQIATKSIFWGPGHLQWILLSLLWFAVIYFLTPAWSNLLTPQTVYREFHATGQELDLLKPAISELLLVGVPLPYVTPTSRNYSLTPTSFGFLANITGYLAEAGSTATTAFLNPGYPSFVGQFNATTGGVNPASPQQQLSGFPTLPKYYQGLSTSYTFSQQGLTANASCRASSSPTITLSNSASVAHTFDAPSGPFDYDLETWSWSTNCSGNGEYSTGEVNLLTSNDTFIGNGLFATSVCFYQDSYGPSNQSFLVVMQSPNGSGYNETYFAAKPNLPIVCEFTPMITTVEVLYNSSTGLANVNRILERTPLPGYAYPLLSIEGFSIWALYLLAQGPYSNSFADSPLELVQLVGPEFGGDPLSLLEQYQRGIIEYMGSVIRGSIGGHLSPNGEALPTNLSTQINGTMSVRTIGWMFHARTHGVAITVITLVTLVTVVSGIVALKLETIPSDEYSGVPAHSFSPTNLIDFTVASSHGSLAAALRQNVARDKLTVRLDVRDRGEVVLSGNFDVTNAHPPG